MQEQCPDEYSVANAQAAKMLKVSRKTLYRLPLSYRQLKPRGRRYYRQSEIDALKLGSIRQPNP